MSSFQTHLFDREEASFLLDHFEKTAKLKTLLESVVQQNEARKKYNNQIPEQIDQLLELEQKLIDHVKQVRCSDNFYSLLREASRSTLIWHQRNNIIEDIKLWDICQDTEDKLLNNTNNFFHRAISDNTDYQFDVPDLQRKCTNAWRGQFTEDPLLIEISDFSQFFEGQFSRVLYSVPHEGAHSAQAQMGRLLTQGRLPEQLFPYSKDALIWQLRKKYNAYILASLSQKAYEAQAIEDVAIVTGTDFQNDLEKMIQENKIVLRLQKNTASPREQAPIMV